MATMSRTASWTCLPSIPLFKALFYVQAEWVIAAPVTVMLDELTDDLAVALHRCDNECGKFCCSPPGRHFLYGLGKR